MKYIREQMNRNPTSIYINITPAGEEIHGLEYQYQCSSKHAQYKKINRKKGSKYITLLFSSETSYTIIFTANPAVLLNQIEGETREIVIHSIHRYFFFFEMFRFVLMLAFLLQQTTKFLHQRLLRLLLLDCQLRVVVHPVVYGQPVAVRGSVSLVGLQIKF